MKKIFAIVLLAVSFSTLSAQISREDVLPLFQQLGEQDFKEARKTSRQLLKKFDKDTSQMMGIVRYAFLFSSAALVSEGKMGYRQLKSQASRLEGEFILMAGHPTKTDTTKLAYNTNTLKMSKGRAQCMTITANKNQTSIYFFEYFDFKDDIDIKSLDGKNTRCGGTLDKIEFNHNESTIWIMRLRIKDAVIREM